MLELAFQPDRERREPLYRQLAEYLRELVAAGRLPAGEKLPATRELAATLQLGRNTVTQAYQILIDDGVLLSHVGQGTFVTSRAAARRPARAAAAAEPRASGAKTDGAPEGGRAFAWGGLISRRARALELPRSWVRERLDVPPPRFDLRPGRMDPDLIPNTDLRRAYARVTARLPEFANAGEPYGWPPLREQVARLLVSRGIRCEASDVAIFSGAQQALAFLSRVLLDPGDTVALEQPGYFGAAYSFTAARARLAGLEVDDEGLRVDQLARLVRSQRVKLVYATPAVQHPTGVVLSESRRRALLELADAHQLPIVEDDYDSEFRYGDGPVPALKTWDPAGQVIYLGTFSKALFPGLRLGYAVAARPLLARLVLARFTSDFGSDVLAQAAVAELLESGALERRVRRLRRAYSERLDAMLEALEASMPEAVRWRRPRGGHSVWVELPPQIDANAVFAGARESGIALSRGSLSYIDGRGADCLSLSFVNHAPDALRRAVAELGAIVARQLRRTA